MTFVKNYFQHRFNPLHVYCRLMDCGINRKLASRVSGFYERWVYRITTSGV